MRDIPYIQTFMVLYQNPILYKGFARPQQELRKETWVSLTSHVSQRETPLPLPYGPESEPT
jgi:hypothetical protein